MGRIGVKVAPSDPRTVYVIAETHEGSLYRSDDHGESFTEVHKDPGIVNRGLYYTDLRVDPANPDRVYAVSSSLQLSIDGGKTFESDFSEHARRLSLALDRSPEPEEDVAG